MARYAPLLYVCGVRTAPICTLRMLCMLYIFYSQSRAQDCTAHCETSLVRSYERRMNGGVPSTSLALRQCNVLPTWHSSFYFIFYKKMLMCAVRNHDDAFYLINPAPSPRKQIKQTGLVSYANYAIEWSDWLADTLDAALNTLMTSAKEYGYNERATEFMGLLFRHFIHMWEIYLAHTRPLYPAAAQFVFSKIWMVGGCSMILAVGRDLLMLMTVHLYYFYIYASFIYTLNVKGAVALSRLFRGKRWNPLRERSYLILTSFFLHPPPPSPPPFLLFSCVWLIASLCLAPGLSSSTRATFAIPRLSTQLLLLNCSYLLSINSGGRVSHSDES